MTRLKIIFTNFITLLLLINLTHQVHAQKNAERFDRRVSILFGLTQPLLASGFNIQGDIFYKRLAFDYSHGTSLDFSGSSVTGEAADQGLSIHMPYTTGFGVGYRFTPWLNLRVEPKWHRFEIYYNGDVQNETNNIVTYNTFSMGLGMYANWLPFKNSDNLLKGIMIAPSLRYWPTLSSSLTDGKFQYVNRNSGQTDTHHVMQPGILNTPLVANISVGYSLNF